VYKLITYSGTRLPNLDVVMSFSWKASTVVAALDFLYLSFLFPLPFTLHSIILRFAYAEPFSSIEEGNLVIS
jgi:hypothetical protein